MDQEVWVRLAPQEIADSLGLQDSLADRVSQDFLGLQARVVLGAPSDLQGFKDKAELPGESDPLDLPASSNSCTD